MPAATASGSDAKSNGAAKSRDHNQGNQDRSCTPEQKAEVLRVRRCQPTAFYEILNLESVKTTVTETEIKKAYRKISLLTHPDKNGHEHADEAFKMVSRAFGVLGDKEKRSKFDRFGGDPDSRFGGGAPQSSPFSGFAGRSQSSRAAGGGGGGSMWEEEISPEEMFNRFFGGGGLGGGFGPFGGGGLFGDGGNQFVFNMGGGPGIRVHQFGGARPRRRPRDPNAPADPPASLQTTLMGLLPLLFILVLPILSSLFSGGGSTATGPSMRFDTAVPPHTLHRHTKRMNVDYFINPTEVENYSASQFSKLDQRAEINFIQRLNVECQQEEIAKQDLVNEATGWFYQDAEKMQQARTMEMKSCRRLDSMGVGRSGY
ncbi:related to HLJ1 protein [Phialocephala subalpina]|uniref:Related to HLJ1 protein n=1 Tax=Phialocephala subalpina TaxID=576137 RepID=A0A1L7X3J9_9HELO|nr:related to HLJ1 protein [Phialocephala subalpina]